MTAEEFLSDDANCQLDAGDIACAGCNKRLAIARLLGLESETPFAAVLDPDGATVWSVDSWGEIVSETLEDLP
jgi:hypothetical protein